MSEKKPITFGKVFWPSLLAVFIMSILGMLIFFLVVGGIVGSFGEKEQKVFSKNTVLHLTLEGNIAEESSATLDPMSMKLVSTIGLSDLLYGFQCAEKDDKIAGVFLELKSAQMGLATAKELRNAIHKFEKSGKFVIAYLSGEVITQKQYYLASAANQVYAFPTSMMEFVGLGGELMFFKNTLDKLGVEMQVIRGHGNDFKSAVEPFFLTKMSDSSRLQMKTYVSNMWLEIRKDIALDRGISASELNDIAENMKVKRTVDAKKLKMIDDAIYYDEVLVKLKTALKSKSTPIEFSSFEKYAKKRFENKQLITQAEKANVAVLIAEGDISVDGDGMSSRKICKAIREIRNDKSIKTLVLRINSPGGSALASDEIWREITLLKQQMKVIVSMGDVAASGGYYIAAPADYIFAENNTITGSIGVFGVIPYTGKLLEDKIGISFDHISTNKHSVISTNRKLSADEFKIIQDEVDIIYSEFIERVAEGRKLAKERVHVLARGRVWTGSDAVKIGLVDEIGGLNQAIDYAINISKIKDVKVLYFPKKKVDPFEKIFEFLEDQEDVKAKFSNKSVTEEFLRYYSYLKKLENYNGIQMRLPFEMIIK